MDDLVYDLDDLDGHGFEAAMAALLERQGYAVERGKLTNDEGRDLILRRAHDVVVVECKHQQQAVGRPVVQKLHSAAATYPGATRALLITTGSFSGGAVAYAQRVKVELWDFPRLAEEARRARVFLTRAGEEPPLVFWVEPRPRERFRDDVWRRWFAGLRSAPRALANVVVFQGPQEEVIPAIVVDYSLDKPFATKAGTVYTAREHGRRIFAEGHRLTEAECSFWLGSDLRRASVNEVSGAMSSLAGVRHEAIRARVATEVASRLSRVVSYAGRNGQVYQRRCEISPSDVTTMARQVLLFRKSMAVRIGPRAYTIVVPDDCSRDLFASALRGFDDDGAALLSGGGIICNDCASIGPGVGAHHGENCRRCGRTLCASHVWRYPSGLFRRELLCSGCYGAAASTAAMPCRASRRCSSYSVAVAAGLLPGLAWMITGQFLVGSAVTLLFAGMIGVGMFSLRLAIALAAVSVVASEVVAHLRVRRVRFHLRNLDELTRYQRRWEEG